MRRLRCQVACLVVTGEMFRLIGRELQKGFTRLDWRWLHTRTDSCPVASGPHGCHIRRPVLRALRHGKVCCPAGVGRWDLDLWDLRRSDPRGPQSRAHRIRVQKQRTRFVSADQSAQSTLSDYEQRVCLHNRPRFPVEICRLEVTNFVEIAMRSNASLYCGRARTHTYTRFISR